MMAERESMPEDVTRAAHQAYDRPVEGDASLNSLVSSSQKQSVIACLENAIHAERRRCAAIAYRVCAETRHVKLGDEARDAIMSSGGEHDA